MITRSISQLMIIALIANLVVATASSDRQDDLDDLRSSLKNIASTYEVGRKADAAKALAKLSDRHHPIDWIREIPSENWASPTRERLGRIDQISGSIKGFEKVLVEMAFDPELNAVARSSASKFLYYAPQSDDLKKALLSKTDYSSEAFLILFETGLFESDVKEKYVEALKPETPKSLRTQHALMAVDWGLPEALPAYLEMLQQPFTPNTISFVDHIAAHDANCPVPGYNVAARAAMYLGPAGNSLLPLIKQRFSEIQEAFPDKHLHLTGTLKAAIDVIQGRINPPVRAAINGRGALSLLAGASPVYPKSEEPVQTTLPTLFLETPQTLKEINHTPQTPPSLRTQSPKSRPWLWVVGTIFFVAVAGGILLKLRRK